MFPAKDSCVNPIETCCVKKEKTIFKNGPFMMTIAPEFEVIRIVKKDQQKRTIKKSGKRLDFFSGHFSAAVQATIL